MYPSCGAVLRVHIAQDSLHHDLSCILTGPSCSEAASHITSSKLQMLGVLIYWPLVVPGRLTGYPGQSSFCFAVVPIGPKAEVALAVLAVAAEQPIVVSHKLRFSHTAANAGKTELLEPSDAHLLILTFLPPRSSKSWS